MMRQPLKTKRQGKGEITSTRTLVAPVKGWNARDPLANMATGFAVYLDNWFPTAGSVDVRGGAADWVTGLGTTPVKSLAVWNARSGTPRRRLFACADTGIYDATTSGTFSSPVAAITDGRCQSVNIAVTGGSYLFVVNGVDSLWQYEGTTWTQVASYAVTGGGTLNTNTIGNINLFKRSLYFLQRDTLDFYYLPIDSIAGTVSRFPLGAIFQKGGSLVAMGTWTVDGGQGVDDLAVFVTSEGQIAVYQGTDPSNSATWSLQGVYDLSTPLGKNCFCKLGGDLIYVSVDGAFPLIKALQSVNTNSTTALTDLISTAFTVAADSYRQNYGWQAVTYYSAGILLVNVPQTEFSLSMQFVQNLKTGAWCRVTDWNAFCFAVMDDTLYMGMSGKVAKAWTGLNDFGEPINCYGKTAFDYLGMRAREKKVNLVRPNLAIGGSAAVNVAVDMDFNNGMDYGPAVFNPATGALWDVALWDVATWTGAPTTRLDWVTTATPLGWCAAVRLRVAAKDATVSWSATDLLYEPGAAKG